MPSRNLIAMLTFLAAVLLLVGTGVALGLLIGHKLWYQSPQASQETFRPGSVQADGSVDLTRIPTAPKDAGPAPHILPKGAKETARVVVKVTPDPVRVEPGQPACSCDAIDLNLSLYEGKDGTGVVASAEGAKVELDGSMYIPMVAPPVPKRHFALLINEPGTDNYTGLIGKRFLHNSLGVGVGMAKREGVRDVPALLGIEYNW